jgi:hypothetical protein
MNIQTKKKFSRDGFINILLCYRLKRHTIFQNKPYITVITKYILGRFLKLKNKEPWATKVRRYTRQPGEVAHSCSPSYLAGRLGESQF